MITCIVRVLYGILMSSIKNYYGYVKGKCMFPLLRIHALLKNVDHALAPMVSHGGIGDHTFHGEVHAVKLHKLQHIHPAIPITNLLKKETNSIHFKRRIR